MLNKLGSLSRAELNTVSRTRPIVIWQRSAHEFYLNDAALKHFKITEADFRKVPAYANYAEGHVFDRDDNLLALSQTLSSRLFFAHVRAATAGGIARQNCHPFRYGRYLFMHNGQIGGYGQLRRTLESQLPDDLYAERRGATDSELLFLLALARIQNGTPVEEAMTSVLDETMALMRERGIDAPLRFAAVLADGEQLHAFRISSDHKAPTLYLRRCETGTIIASEPLCEDEPGWQMLPDGAVVAVRAGQSQVRVHPKALAFA